VSTMIERRRQAVEALELRARGGSLVDIAHALKCSPSTAQRRLRQALEQLGAESSDELRREAEVRFSDVLTRVYLLLDSGTLDARTELTALALIRQVTKDLAWLLGSNVPATVILKNEGLNV
jgi:DNA-binding NarL/FixJ family response regulator